jgi:hypothetical protein
VYTQLFIKESVWFHHYLAKKEAKRLEKEAKLAAKVAKAVTTATTSTPAGEKKAKEKAAKDGVVAFVNTTPKGQKKGESLGRWEEVWSYCVWRIYALSIEWNCFPPSAMLIRCCYRFVRSHGCWLRSDCRRSCLV